MTDDLTPSIVIPWRDGGCPHRAAALAIVVDWLEDVFPFADLQLVDATPDGPWSRGQSIDLGVERAHRDLILVADADMLTPASQLYDALKAAADSPGQVIPFDLYRYLTEPTTARLRAGWPLEESAWVTLPAKFTMSTSVGGTMAITRSAYEAAGGHDPRFVGWGGQDYGFYFAADTLAGPMRRIAGPSVHLFHPTDPHRPPSNMDLMGRYSSASGDPDAMRELIAERALDPGR